MIKSSFAIIALLATLLVPGKVVCEAASPWSRAGCLIWQNPTPSSITEGVMRMMANASTVFLDIEYCDAESDLIDRLKEINPDVKIGLYVNPMEVFVMQHANRAWQNSIISDLLDNFDEVSSNSSFFVYTPDHKSKIINFYSGYGMYLMNLSAKHCPNIGGKVYHQYISQKISEKVAQKSNLIDYILIDNCLRDITWFANSDINWNGITDSTDRGKNYYDNEIDIEWRNGIRQLAEYLKAQYPGIKIIGNQPNDYFKEIMDGKQFEYIHNPMPGPKDFKPEGGQWPGELAKNPSDLLRILENYLLPELSYNIFQGGGDYSYYETACVLALLHDNGMFSWDHNFDLDKVPSVYKDSLSQLMNKLTRPMGESISEAYNSGNFRMRRFEKALAVFNHSSTESIFYWNLTAVPIEGHKGLLVFSESDFDQENIIYVSTDGTCGGKGPCFKEVPDALSSVDADAIFLIAGGEYEGFVLDRPIAMVFQGDWDSRFLSRNNPETVINGDLTILDGTVMVDGLVIQ